MIDLLLLPFRFFWWLVTIPFRIIGWVIKWIFYFIIGLGIFSFLRGLFD